MGGLFNKKKPEKEPETGSEERATARKSRRVVTPGGKPGAPTQQATPARPATTATARPEAPAAPKPSAPSQPTSRVPKPGAPDPAAARRPQQPTPLPGMPAPATAPGPAPAARSAPQRPASKAPIEASKPLEFAGDLASGARRGPCRTGDAALLEFLTKQRDQNPPILSAEQAAQVRERAQAEALAIDTAAIRLGFLSEEQLVNVLTQECWVPHLKVDKYEIRKKALDTVGRDDALYYGVFPVDKLGSLLTLAMVNPLDTETIRTLEAKTGLDIKKVVATRSEIVQGIEKYYSGTVKAKEGSLDFHQDAEQRSVTQMLSKVPAAAPAPAPKPAPAPAAAAHADVVPEIQDIDELLTSDEVIAPAIIEPVSIEPIVEEPAAEPVIAEPEVVAIDDIEPEIADLPPTAPAARSAAPTAPELEPLPGFADEEPAAPEPLIAKSPAAKRAPEPAVPAEPDLSPELEPLFAPEPPKPQPAPVQRAEPPKPAPIPAPVPAAPAPPPVVRAEPPKPAAPPPKPAAVPPSRPASVPQAPVAKPAPAPVPAPAPKPAPAKSAPQPAAAKPAPAKAAPAASQSTGRAARSFTNRTSRQGQPNQVNLIPVMEEEFQHAITHGKAHVFEKWVGLQTRNRIINGIPVEQELEDVIGLMAAGARRIS